MPKLHIHTSPLDEHRVPAIMKIIEHYKGAHYPMTQLVALHELLTLADGVLSKKHMNAKEKEKREEKEVDDAA